MRVKIEYQYDSQASANYPCWARSVVNGKPVCTCGTDWNEVRKEHLERLAAVSRLPEPPIAEEVEL